jgi:hypothetical protein
MNKKIVVYTAIFGNYSGLVDQPKLKNVDYICYTDRKNLKSKRWQMVYVPQPVKEDDTRSSRYYKILAHKHLSEEYDTSVFIDGNVLILKDFSDLITEKLNRNKMAYFDHNQSKGDARNCIYKEYEGILELEDTLGIIKDSKGIMKKQVEGIKAAGYPKNNGLIASSVLIRKHFDQEVIDLMEAWWHMVLNQSKRDQLSFNYVAWKLNFKSLALIDGDVRKGNPWFYTITHRQKYGSKVRRVLMNRLLGFKKL